MWNYAYDHGIVCSNERFLYTEAFERHCGSLGTGFSICNFIKYNVPHHSSFAAVSQVSPIVITTW